MAKIKPMQAHAEEIIDHFSGIGSQKTFGEGEVDGFIKKILFYLQQNSITLR